MDQILSLPDIGLADAGPASRQFLARDILRYHDAARYVRSLSYGRNSDRANSLLVLPEQRGACSTKHALLAALAAEQGMPVSLTLGIFRMSERNTPGVGPVLERHALTEIPEAHCYLRCNGTRVDLT